MKIYFAIACLFFFIPLKYYLFTKYKFLIYPHFFHKILTQSLIKDKNLKIRDEREMIILK
jgi:hypothetical protein